MDSFFLGKAWLLSVSRSFTAGLLMYGSWRNGNALICVAGKYSLKGLRTDGV
jgi:hypothetical protein